MQRHCFENLHEGRQGIKSARLHQKPRYCKIVLDTVNN